MSTPLVSVVMPSYNHARFIGRAIESVLSQSFSDFEFLIADDGSRDESANVIRSYKDKRIVFFENKENRGACVVHNDLLAAARGEYVALINSDDMWVEGKLEYQVNFMESNKGVGGHFGRASYIDENDNEIKKSSMPFGRVFDQDNRSQANWLRFFFDVSNCLCHPTSMIRRACYTEIGGYNNRFRQLPDYDMWIRFVKRYQLHIGEDPLIRFRVLPGENASAATEQNQIRVINEHYLIAAHFFDDLADDIFLQAFADRLAPDVADSLRCIRIEQTLQYFTPNQWLGGVYKAVGLRRLFDHLNHPEERMVLSDVYGIDDRVFQKMSVEFDAFRPRTIMSAIPDREIVQEFWYRVRRRLRQRFGAPGLNK